jgi:hypothetical protein
MVEHQHWDHAQRQDFIRFLKILELLGVRSLAAEHLRQVFAGQQDLGSHNEGSEQSIDLLDIHSIAAIAALEEFPQAIKFGFRQLMSTRTYLMTVSPTRSGLALPEPAGKI